MLSAVETIDLKPDLGQVLTPVDIADKMVNWASDYLPRNAHIKILDPAVGPATFLKAIRKSSLKIESFDCYDVDEYMCHITKKQGIGYPFKIKVKNQDFLLDGKEDKYDFIILNPPYIRQENLSFEYKSTIRHNLINNQIGSINGRSNLFIYFLCKSLQQLNENGVMCAIVYDSIMHTQYGQDFMKYVCQYFDVVKFKNVSAPFDGALIDASILIVKKEHAINRNHAFSIPEAKSGYVQLSELMNIRRGTTLPSRKIFLAHPEDGEIYKFSLPIIMKPYDREVLIVERADSRYYRYGLNCEVDRFLSAKAKDSGANYEKVLFKEIFGNILLNYYIRNKPRHLYNHNSISASDNFYVCKTYEGFPNEVAWLLLNSDLYKDALLNSARNQGSGLKKLQVYEYENASVPDWRSIAKNNIQRFISQALSLIKHKASPCEVNKAADRIVKEGF